MTTHQPSSRFYDNKQHRSSSIKCTFSKTEYTNNTHVKSYIIRIKPVRGAIAFVTTFVRSRVGTTFHFGNMFTFYVSLLIS